MRKQPDPITRLIAIIHRIELLIFELFVLASTVVMCVRILSGEVHLWLK